MNCKICGKPVKLEYMEDVNNRLKDLEVCFDCNFWLEVVTEYNFQEKIEGLIGIWIKPDYEVYYAKETNLNQISNFKGFGGKTFIATLMDGSTQESSNVWHRGEIPKPFRGILEPNVEKIESDWERSHGSVKGLLCKECGNLIADESVGCIHCKTK